LLLSDEEIDEGYSLSFAKTAAYQNTSLPQLKNLQSASLHEIEIEELDGDEVDEYGSVVVEEQAEPSWDELKKPVIELLLKYYNGEDHGSDFVEALSAVLKVLLRWRSCGPLNAQSLLNFMIDQVLAVLLEVKNKLICKAIDKYDLHNREIRADTDGAPAGPGGSEKFVKDYPECPAAFDQMVISLTQYFELLNLNSDKIEDLWLNLLEAVGLERPNQFTVFKAVHHQGFRNMILKDPLMQQIVREVDSFKDSGLACISSGKYLE